MDHKRKGSYELFRKRFKVALGCMAIRTQSPRVKGRTAKAIRVLERLTRAYAEMKVGEQAGWKQARSCQTTR